MEPRALKRILQLPASRRLDVIEEGLALLVEHVGVLRDDIVHLHDAARVRGMSVIQIQADEEGAKVLILLDLVRAGITDQIASRQISCFYDHLARCIYADMVHMSPATFGEIRRLIELERKSHFLDGPSDVDWVFRNQLIAARENSLYVDWVDDEEGGRWTSPARCESSHFGPSTAVQDLVLALAQMGCTSRTALDIIADEWAGVHLEDETHWQTVAGHNRSIIAKLADAGLTVETATVADAGRVVDNWGFPLTSLNVREEKVPASELEAERARVLASFHG